MAPKEFFFFPCANTSRLPGGEAAVINEGFLSNTSEVLWASTPPCSLLAIWLRDTPLVGKERLGTPLFNTVGVLHVVLRGELLPLNSELRKEVELSDVSGGSDCDNCCL
ncbi:hypothetical protein TcCL_ESM04189 [Trypanosoma cruzi]|nr:hypothetical protein TcCL_ESM04189 [Trypanosoma cruzi]